MGPLQSYVNVKKVIGVCNRLLFVLTHTLWHRNLWKMGVPWMIKQHKILSEDTRMRGQNDMKTRGIAWNSCRQATPFHFEEGPSESDFSADFATFKTSRHHGLEVLVKVLQAL